MSELEGFGVLGTTKTGGSGVGWVFGPASGGASTAGRVVMGPVLLQEIPSRCF
jgi:hypothetical protein